MVLDSRCNGCLLSTPVFLLARGDLLSIRCRSRSVRGLRDSKYCPKFAPATSRPLPHSRTSPMDWLLGRFSQTMSIILVVRLMVIIKLLLGFYSCYQYHRMGKWLKEVDIDVGPVSPTSWRAQTAVESAGEWGGGEK